MNIFDTYKSVVDAILASMAIAGELPPGMDLNRVKVEPPKDISHGDLSTNAAMVLSKAAGKNPRELGESIAEKLRTADGVREVTLAGPGFINFRLTAEAWQKVAHAILKQGTAFGDSQMGKGEKVNVEYVSVNPTGPMHAGHMRGAVIGDVLANLLQKAGYDVSREYYFNDAGTQVDVLARTAYLRYREAMGENIGEIPEGLYPGEYMKAVGEAMAKRDGDKWMNRPEQDWLAPMRAFAVARMIETIKADLALIGIRHDVFTNEREIVENGTLDKVFTALKDMDLIYQGTLPPPKGKEMEDWEPAELTLFRSSKFGDSSDRPLKKRDGTWAYIMPDIAYHYDKMQRGFMTMINVLGKDHGNYLDKMKPAIAALSDGRGSITVQFCGMVKLFKNGEPVKLSKRAGNIITLREIVEEVGPGVVRFYMMTRTPDTEMDFDFAKVVEQSKDNPVFYVQYAHARCHSVLRNAREMFGTADIDLDNVDLSLLSGADEIELIRQLSAWPRQVELAAEAKEAHRITGYLHDVASAFHAFWNKGRDDATLRFLHPDNRELSFARLALVRAVVTVIASGLAVMGVEPLEELHG